MPVAGVVSPAFDSPTLSGLAGGTLPAAIKVQVVAASGIEQGQPVPNIGIRLVDALDQSAPPAARCAGSGGIVLTDSRGIATCDLVLTAVPGSYYLRVVTGEFNVSRAIPLQVNAGPSCAVSLSPQNQSFTEAGGVGAVSVTIGQGCGWTASSNSAWLLISSAASGSGNGSR